MCVIVIQYLILMNTYGAHSKCQTLRKKGNKIQTRLQQSYGPIEDRELHIYNVWKHTRAEILEKMTEDRSDILFLSDGLLLYLLSSLLHIPHFLYSQIINWNIIATWKPMIAVTK